MILSAVHSDCCRIYTKVATIKQQQIASPLDVATGRANSSIQHSTPPAAASALVPAERKKQPVGRMRFEITPRPQDKGSLTPVADICLSVMNDPPVKMDGIVASQPRKGWIALDLPPLERWQEPMKWLCPEQRERIESPEFYQWLQSQISSRYFAMFEGR